MNRRRRVLYLLRRIRFPRVEQVEEADCGPAALLAVLRYWGGDASLSEVRRLAGTRADGTSLAGLAEAARALGLAPRAAVGGYEALRAERMPCLAHLILPDGLQHFVVLRRVRRRRVAICDPTGRLRSLPRDRFEALWSTRAVLLLAKGHPDAVRRQGEEPWYVWVARRGAKEPGWLPQSLFLGGVSAVAALVTAIYIQVLVDRLIPRGDLGITLLASGLLLLLLLLGAAVDYMRARFLIRLARVASSRTTLELLSGLFTRDPGSVGEVPSGDPGTRVREGITLHRGMVEALGVMLIEGITLLGATGLLLVIAPVLALTAMVVLPLHGLMVALRAGHIRRGHDLTLATLGAAEAGLSDGLRGAHAIRALGAGSPCARRIHSAFDHMLARVEALEETTSGLRLVSAVSSSLLIVSGLSIGAAQVVDGTLMLGELVGAYSLLTGAVGSVNRALGGFLRLQEVRVAAGRARVLVVGPGRLQGPPLLPSVRRELRLELRQGAHFLTASGPVSVFAFPVGVVVGLAGPSGAGKTTLLRMLAGGLPDIAHLRADGRPIGEMSLRAYRTRVGFVPRDPHVFRGTLRFNVLLDRPELNTGTPLRRLETEGFADLHERFPLGWDTPIGTGARSLSAGERQLVGLLRALAGRPDVLLLDEGLAGLDQATRARVLQRLLRLFRNRILVIASHASDVLASSDRVVQLTRINLPPSAATVPGATP